MGTPEEYVEWLRNKGTQRTTKLSLLLQETLEVADTSRGYAEVGYDVSSDFSNFAGSVHGGIISTIADQVGGIAVGVLVGPLPMSTLEFKVSFFAKVLPGRVLGKGLVVRRTRKIVFTEVEILDANGVSCAKATATYLYRLPKDREEEERLAG
jgi:uncharacterized protein (TIGR00369 family)